MIGRTKTTVSTFRYTIEPKPDGGFIGRPSDQTLGTVEGATREDVQKKVAARLEELGRQQAPPFLFGTTVSIDRTGDDAPPLDAVSRDPRLETQLAQLESSTRRTAKIIQFVISALVLLGFWHYALRR